MKYAVIIAVAAAVFLLMKKAKAEGETSYEYAINPDNWDYLPGYKPGSGVML